MCWLRNLATQSGLGSTKNLYSTVPSKLIVVYFLFVETQGASIEEAAAILVGAEIQDRFIEGVARAIEKDIKDQVLLEVKIAEVDGKTGRKVTQ